MKPNDKCPDCGCKFKTKYMIRADYDNTPNDNMAKSFWESTSKASVVGWIKFICNNYGNFQEIQIINLKTECSTHKKYYKNLELEKCKNEM